MVFAVFLSFSGEKTSPFLMSSLSSIFSFGKIVFPEKVTSPKAIQEIGIHPRY
jgi:hypothetical protein